MLLMSGRGAVASEQTGRPTGHGAASSLLVLMSIITVLDLKTSYMAGYVVLGATALSTAAILAL